MAASEYTFYDRRFSLAWPVTLLLAVAMLGGLAASLAESMGADPQPPVRWLGPACFAVAIVPLALFLPSIRVRVTQSEVVVSWGFLELLNSRFSLGSMQRYRKVSFSPLRDFGGWGWRFGRGGARCYNMRGNRGVELTIAGTRYIIGVDDPDELVHAIEQATGMHAASPHDDPRRTG